MLYAHTPRVGDDRWHDLGEHLNAVAELAAANATPFRGSGLARWAGRWHDVGKASKEFQEYLLACHREPGKRHKTRDHKGAGSLLAIGVCDELAFLIQGHHGGLPNRSELGTKIKERAAAPVTKEAQQRTVAAGLIPMERPKRSDLPFPDFVRDPLSRELFLRMLFSALVDADHLDTERHMAPEKAETRGGTPDLAALAARLEGAQAEFANVPDGPVNRVRAEVYAACLQAAEMEPGFFRLTVPTGGGKTRSGLAFALRHALRHELRRVVVAVPYLTITDQTADVFRQILGDDRAVLEHHSGAGEPEDPDGLMSATEVWRRLTAQDWDAPVIVTTTVQLFQSLFGRTPSVCRKLHRLARSVIVLDEVQTLPSTLLAPILDVLRELVANYGVSVVLCTATQPEFSAAPGFADLGEAKEIAPEPRRLFRTLKRVEYEWPRTGEPAWDWFRVAEELRASQQGLAVVNTRANALALLDALDDPAALHLSTLMCGAHRRDVLAEIRRRLAAGEPCRVVSTQVVEAGVDIDFPLVLRALGPLDRIVQAAGRCNREGRLPSGRVVVFSPEGGGLPPGSYKTATEITEGLISGGEIDVDDPDLFRRYFAELFPIVELDAKGIQAARARLAYREVASEFRMIEDDTASVFVPYGLTTTVELYGNTRNSRLGSDHVDRVQALLADLRGIATGWGAALPKRVLAQAQPYLVTVRDRLVPEYQADGLVSPVMGDIYVWEGRYHPVRGLIAEGRDAASFVI